MTEPNAKPEPDPKPDDSTDPDPKPDPKPEDGGDKKFSQAELDRIIGERLERERERAKAEAAEEQRKAEEAARRKALKDQEDFKSLSESQAAELAQKDERITALEASEARVTALEERLEKIVDARLGNVEEGYKSLLKNMTVEERADWIEANPKLVANATAGGSPATPEPAGPPNRDKEADKAADQNQRMTAVGAV